MKRQLSKGSPEQFINLVKNRINMLQDKGDIDSSFVYPDDLGDLENGEYESHVTEPVNASTLDNYTELLQSKDDVTAEVLEFMHANLGWDIMDKRVQNYADAVAEYIDMSREALGYYTVENWYNDTVENYPEELEEFENMDAVEECDNIYSNKQSIYPDKTELIDWLFDHGRAYEDASDAFGTNDLDNDVSYDDLLSWVYEHGQLSEDFERHFGITGADFDV